MIDLSRLVEAPASSLPYVDPAFPNRPLVLHSARPRDYHIGTPVLFVHHGVRRNGRDYRDYWLDQVNEAGVLAIAIEFPEASFPEYLCYHFGNLHDKEGMPNPREEWTFGIVERLFELLLAQGVTTRQRYGLFGHSAGGQFVHRMVSFGFRDRVAVAVSANAGTYAMPDLSTLAVRSRSDGCRHGCMTCIARLSYHGNGGHRGRGNDRTFFPQGPAFHASGCIPL